MTAVEPLEPPDTMSDGTAQKPAAPTPDGAALINSARAKAYAAGQSPSQKAADALGTTKMGSLFNAERRIKNERANVISVLAEHARQQRRWTRLRGQVAPEGGEPSAVEDDNDDETNGCPWVILPNAAWKMTWDIFVILLVIYNAVSLPVYVGFRVTPVMGLFVFDYIVDCCFAVDIVFSFRTGYYSDEGELIRDCKPLAQNYMRGWFCIDFFATFPFEVCVPQGSGDQQTAIVAVQALKCVRLLRLGRLFKILNRSSAGKANMASIFNLIMLLFLLCHWIACAWMIVQWAHADQNITSWISEQQYDLTEDSGTLYPFVMYAAMLMLSGDGISTTTQTESWFAVMMTLLGLTALAILVSNMAVYMSNLNAHDRIRRETVSSMSDEMQFLGIPNSLRTRVLDYYEFIFDQQPHLIQQASWLDRFPRYLQSELRSYLHLADLEAAPIFKGLSRGFLNELALHLRTQVFMKQEFLFRHGDFGDEMYLVQQGTVAVYKNLETDVPGMPKMKVVSKKNKGDVIGELAVIFRQPRAAGAIAENVVVCNVLQKSSFESVIVDFHADREVIQINLENAADYVGDGKIFWDSKYVCFRRMDDLHSNMVRQSEEHVDNEPGIEHLRYEFIAFKESTRESLSKIAQQLTEIRQGLNLPPSGSNATATS